MKTIPLGEIMSIFGNIQEISLNEGQMISDILPLLEDGTTLLKAPTGTGKSTFVMQTLMAGQHVIMLCPKVSQVQQLESMYQDKGIIFCHGKFTATQEELSNNHIVATYDQLPKIEAYIRPETILVVDEVHQLYSAGNYRGKALLHVIHGLLTEKVKKILLMSATITEDLLSCIGLPIIDHYYQITQENPVQRRIILQRFAHEHHLNSLSFIINRVNFMKKTNPERILLVRLNDIKKAKMYKYFLEKQGITALVVNRSNQDTEEIICMLELNMLSTQYNVIITTSVWDEAVSFMNSDEQIDSIHILGSNVHVDEITQFIGRTRIANPPVYIHLDYDIGMNHFVNINDFHNEKMDAIWFSYNIKYDIAHKMVDLLQSIKELNGCKPIALVENYNNASKACMGLEVLGCIDEEILINSAVMAAQVFMQDTSNMYLDLNYLSYRLAGKIGHSIITSDVETNLVDDLVEQQYTAYIQQKFELCDVKVQEVAKKFLENTSLTNSMSRHGECILQTPSLIPYLEKNDPVGFDLYQEVAETSIYINNMHDILCVLKTGTFSKVKKIGLDYLNDPMVKAVMDHIARQVFQKSSALKIYDTQKLEKLINQGLKKLDANSAVKLVLSVSNHKYFKLDEKARIVIKPKQAVNFIDKYCHILVKNSKKPYEKKVVTFVGLGWSGYQFCGLQYVGSSKPQWIELNGCKLDARSGQVLNGILAQSVAA